MEILRRWFLCATLVCAASALSHDSGYARVPDKALGEGLKYEPVASPVRIDASASFEVTTTLTPRRQAKMGLTQANVFPVLNARGRAIVHDLTSSGLFARIVTRPEEKADYLVKVLWEDNRLTLTAENTADGQLVSSHVREIRAGKPDGGISLIQEAMVALKANLVDDLKERPPLESVRVRAVQDELAMLNQATLPDLLAGSDQRVDVARARNNAIVAAKTLQLPKILSDWKTAELTALIVRIEQTILTLSHECELAKDQAQVAVADGRPSGSMEKWRDLALSYRERVELLKPIVAAIKEEIANRNR